MHLDSLKVFVQRVASFENNFLEHSMLLYSCVQTPPTNNKRINISDKLYMGQKILFITPTKAFPDILPKKAVCITI